MFKNVLVPISSEFYNKEVLRRSVFLADKFNSSINLIYIIEKKTMDQTDKITESYLSDFGMKETKKQMMREQAKTADTIIFDDAKQYFKDKQIKFEEKIVRGEFSDSIRYELGKKPYDLILMGFEKECLLNYRLLEDVDIPVWIEEKSEGKKILAVCSNLAPNQKVPDVGIKLSEVLGWNLYMLYVVDTEDSVQVDENCQRSDKKLERDLLFSGQTFSQEMNKKGIKVDIVKGSLEKETARAAEKLNASLVVVGREQKKKGMLGLPVKNVKKKIAEKCEYSILFLH
jgi:nucleotide-binding universal stress UspA family protein